jgi:FkbM family methyltransferase
MNTLRPLRRFLSRSGRSLCETMGVARYSRPAQYSIDRKLERHLDFDGGFFIEAGANDGYDQSNTYYFEKMRGWTGVLIEPVPALAVECRRNRRGPVVEAALVAEARPGERVELHFAGLMSTLDGALGGAAETARHVAQGLEVQRLAGSYRLQVPARTLSAILDELAINRPIDLLSLEVEGAEAAALRGLDFARHAPRFVCVEARDRPAIETVLSPRYRLLEVLTDLGSHQDLLYILR